VMTILGTMSLLQDGYEGGRNATLSRTPEYAPAAWAVARSHLEVAGKQPFSRQRAAEIQGRGRERPAPTSITRRGSPSASLTRMP